MAKNIGSQWNASPKFDDEDFNRVLNEYDLTFIQDGKESGKLLFNEEIIAEIR
jgi:hypothetical protein